MNEKVKEAFKKLCENYVRDINQLKGKKIAQDYFYNDKYEVEYNINGEWVATADILKAFDNMEELIKSKDDYIAKLCNDRAEKSSALRIQENNNIRLVESNLHLIEENKELRTFVKILCKMKIVDSNPKIYGINENDIALIKKVLEKYGERTN